MSYIIEFFAVISCKIMMLSTTATSRWSNCEKSLISYGRAGAPIGYNKSLRSSLSMRST